VTETEKERKARSFIAGALSLIDGMQHPYGGITQGKELAAPMALLELAASTLDGKDEKREAKNAGDRARRAKAKTAPKKARPKKGKGWGAALTGGKLDS
jgi:hypothetical protein